MHIRIFCVIFFGRGSLVHQIQLQVRRLGLRRAHVGSLHHGADAIRPRHQCSSGRADSKWQALRTSSNLSARRLLSHGSGVARAGREPSVLLAAQQQTQATARRAAVTLRWRSRRQCPGDSDEGRQIKEEAECTSLQKADGSETSFAGEVHHAQNFLASVIGSHFLATLRNSHSDNISPRVVFAQRDWQGALWEKNRT